MSDECSCSHSDSRRPSRPRPGRLVVITGPSGVGKSTIVRRVLAATGAEFSVSVTTRPPRAGEVDGTSYRFIDAPTFQRMIEQGQLLEWAEVHGNYYGTPAEPVRQALAGGRTMVLEIDVQGGLQVVKRHPDAMFVLILPPDDAELRRRLTGRATDAPEVVERRLAMAQEEIRTAQASGAYTHTVVNDDLDRAVRRVTAIVQERQDD